MKKALYLLGLSLVLIVLVPAVRVTTGQSREATGVVSSVYKQGQGEIVFKISGLSYSFCMKGPQLAGWRDKLLGQTVKIRYSSSWTPLDPGCRKQVAELSVNERLLYSISDQ